LTKQPIPNSTSQIRTVKFFTSSHPANQVGAFGP